MGACSPSLPQGPQEASGESSGGVDLQSLEGRFGVLLWYQGGPQDSGLRQGSSHLGSTDPTLQDPFLLGVMEVGVWVLSVSNVACDFEMSQVVSSCGKPAGWHPVPQVPGLLSVGVDP